MPKGAVGFGVLVLLSALTAGCARARTDSRVATDIKARMYSDAQLRGTQLGVIVNGGVATVSGQVPSVAARYEAFKLTAQTPGVKQVVDQMTVVEPEENPATTATSSAPPAEAPAAEAAATRAASRRELRTRRATREREQAQEAEQPPVPELTAPVAESQPTQPPGPQTPSAAAAPAMPEPPPITQIEIPAGTPVNIRMIEAIDSESNHTGEIFHASLDSPLAVGNQVIAPRGTDIYVRLVQGQSAGRLTGQSELRVELYRMELNGKSYPLVSGDYDLKGTSRGKRSVATVLGGAAVGAAIGAIAGGGKGAAIGAGVGGGGGAVYQGTRKGQQVKIPSETLLNFRLTQPVEVTLNPPGAPPTTPNNRE